jgi:signal peptidase I
VSPLTGDLKAGAGARPSPPQAPDQAGRPVRSGTARRIAVILLGTALAVALIRGLIVQSFVVPTGSMTPTVQAGDRVLVSRLAYRLGDIRRGDVVVFDGAGVFEPELAPARTGLAGLGRGTAAALGVPIGSSDYVKRVIGLPGERVVCCDPQGRITVDDVALAEPYVFPGEAASSMRFDVVVPAGRLWVMGDHRSDSADSRAHLGDPGGGTVPVRRVIGRVAAVYWPPSHVGRVDRIPSKAFPGAANSPGGPGGANLPIGRTHG